MSRFYSLLLAVLIAGFIVSPSYAAGGDNGGYSKSKDEFESVYELIDAEKFARAHQELLALQVEDREADRLNLLGFTARKSGNYDDAGDYYEQALAIDPKHLGALEYQGELFITLGQMDKAKGNLAKIDAACWFSCDEEDQLREAIEAAAN